MLQLLADQDSPDALAIGRTGHSSQNDKAEATPTSSASTAGRLSSSARKAVHKLTFTSPKRRRAEDDAEQDDGGRAEGKRVGGKKRLDVAIKAKVEAPHLSEAEVNLPARRGPEKDASPHASPLPAAPEARPPPVAREIPPTSSQLKSLLSSSLAPSSQPLSSQPLPTAHLGEDWSAEEVSAPGKIVWVAVKPDELGEGHFWWPARLKSATQADLYRDTGREISTFTPGIWAFEPSASTILTFKTKTKPFLVRFRTIDDAASSNPSRTPSDEAFASAVKQAASAAVIAAVDEDDELPDANDAMTLDLGEDPFRHVQSQQSMVTLTQSSAADVEASEADASEDEDEEEEEDVDLGPDLDLTIPGEVVLARDRPLDKGGDWWPAKLLAYDGLRPPPGARAGSRNTRQKKIPLYAVQFCDGVVKAVPRDWFLGHTEPEFRKVQVGRVRSTETKTTAQLAESVAFLLPKLQRIVDGLDDAVGVGGLRLRHEFLAGGIRRRKVGEHACYGGYSEDAVATIGDLVKAEFCSVEEGAEPLRGAADLVALEAADQILFCSDVLVPQAIRLLTIEEHLDDAKAELRDEAENLGIPAEDIDGDAIRRRATVLAEKCLLEEDMVAQVHALRRRS